jgi:DNA-binding MurR/RpiR family transcriptional regulator
MLKKRSLRHQDGFMSRLTPRRREMIRPLLEQPRRYVLLSLRGTSREIKSDPATLLRTVRAMGFKQYQDFQRYLHDRCIAFSTPLEVMERTPPHAGGLRGLVDQSIERDIENLKQLRFSLDFARLVDVAKTLYRARRIVVIGGDMAISIVHFLEYNLAVLGLNSVLATTPGAITHRLQHIGKRDAVLAISFGRGLQQTVEGLKRAHENGAHCIGISDSYVSPLCQYADLFFVASTERISFADSYVAGLSLVNTLLVTLAHRHRKRTLKVLREVAKEQRSSYRWYAEPS